MRDRPEIDQRVRVLGNTGIPNVAGRVGTVVGHHIDGTAVRVELVARAGWIITVDPQHVERASNG